MFYMLSCFNLDQPDDINKIQEDLEAYATCMREQGLLISIDPAGLRDTNTRLDTDSERDQQYFTLTRFRDKRQSEAAVKHIEDQIQPAATLHRQMYSRMKDLIFICWKDEL